MRIRIALAGIALATLGLTACGAVDVNNPLNPTTASAPVTINNAEALKAALAAAGINQDVRVADTTDGSIAVWASVPGFQNCPILWTAQNNQYKASKLLKPDGTLADMSELQAQPTAEQIALFALTHSSIFTGCKGSNNKPTAFPTVKP